ncbi:MAG: hypothetical protein H7839_15860 [Magnetococcus sp. YQC-5]
MFIGHFAVGFSAKAVAPDASLGSLVLAAQLPDLLWPTLLALGMERVHILPGATVVTPLVFEHYPISHGLMPLLGWAGILGLFHFLTQRKAKTALVLAALVLSHWLLDAIVHQPDLPLFPGSEMRVGLNAWSSLPLTVTMELAIFLFGLWLYARTTTSRDARDRWGFWVLLVCLVGIYLGNLFGPPPPSVAAIAWTGQAQWLLVLWCYWIDKNRPLRCTGRDNL